MSNNSSHQIQHEEQEDESDVPFTDKLSVAALFIVAGPLGLLAGPKAEEPKVFLWGVGTSLLYVGLFGFLKTVSVPTIAVELGLEPHLETVAASLAAANDYLMALFQQPETYLSIFAVGLAIVTVGTYRLINWDSDDLPGSDHNAK